MLKKARELDPKSQLVANNYITALQRLGKVSESREVLNALQDKRDQSSIPAAQKAHQLKIDGKDDLAEKVYREAILQDPLDVSSYINLGSLLIENGDLDEAEKVLKKAISTKKSGSVVHMNLGYLYLQKKKYSESQIASEVAVKLNPESSTAWLNLGLSLVYQNKIDEARSAWQRALSLDSENEQIIKNLKAIESN